MLIRHRTLNFTHLEMNPSRQEAITAQSFYQPIRTIQKGDLEAGFKQADHVLEGRIVCVISPDSS